MASDTEDEQRSDEEEVLANGVTLYVPEFVLGSRKRRGKERYLIKWKGHSDLSWESADKEIAEGNRSCWSEQPIVRRWKRAREQGTLEAHVHVAVETSPSVLSAPQPRSVVPPLSCRV